MNIPVKAEMENENLEKYNCFVCKSLKFSSNYVEYVFEKNHKSCLNYPISSWKRLSKLSISDKILHLIDCDLMESVQTKQAKVRSF